MLLTLMFLFMNARSWFPLLGGNLVDVLLPFPFILHDDIKVVSLVYLAEYSRIPQIRPPLGAKKLAVFRGWPYLRG